MVRLSGVKRPEVRRAVASVRWGHTLVEMMIVVTIIAGVSAVAMPQLNYAGMRLDANARAVRAVLQQAWRLSIQKQHDVVVSCDVAGKRVRTLEDNDNDRAVDAGERITWRPLEEGAYFTTPPSRIGSATPPNVVAGSGVVALDGMPSVVFHRNGSTSGDAEVYLAITSRKRMERRAVVVAQATGRTDWYKYLNGSWRLGGL